MGKRVLRYAKSASHLYAKKGVMGVFRVVATKTRYVCLPTIYRNDFLRKIQHPKLETVYLELTNKCNLRCRMCNWQARGNTGYISRQLFGSCIDQFSEIGLDTLNLQFGGESLLHPDFKDFLKYAVNKRDHGKIGSVGWTTNGMLFDQNIADLVVSLNVDWINFSLDGIGQINDNIRIGSKYSLIEKNIKYLLEKRGNANKPKVLLNIVDHGKTEEQKLDFFREWVMYVDEIELLPSILSDNTCENKKNGLENLAAISPPAFCHYPLDTMILTWDGKVTYCCFDTCIKTVLGDANRESIKQIWNSSQFQNLRKEVLTNNFSPGSPCNGCEFWKVNFEPRTEIILDGKAKMEYGYIYRRIHKSN